MLVVLVLVGIVISNQHIVTGYSVTNCNDLNSCSSASSPQSITDDIVNCMGYSSCYDAVSITSSLWTNCNGFQACRYATSITSTTDYVNCNGHYGCYKAGTIYAAQYISCRGQFSCASAIMSTNKGDSTDTYIHCRGENSCNDAIISNTEYLYCMGPTPCLSTKVANVNYIYSYGINEMRYSNISGIKQLRVFGTGSLYHSNIYSDGNINSNINSPMEIYLYGWYSGNELKIYCYSGDICQIYCNSNTACFGTEIYCFGDCTISCNDDSEYFQCPTVFGTYQDPEFESTGSTTSTMATAVRVIAIPMLMM